MKNENIGNALDSYLGDTKPTPKKVQSTNGVEEEEVCDMQTGECYTLRSKDGLVEKVNKRMVTEDGRTLLMG
jgi:hypothetical protein|tara:strand:- start:6403 stop:6618 length:216 start_codon:yes stop_codon:yes gene_type:complete